MVFCQPAKPSLCLTKYQSTRTVVEMFSKTFCSLQLFLPTPLAVAWVNRWTFSPPPPTSPPSSHHQLFVSLRYIKRGVWVFRCDAILFLLQYLYIFICKYGYPHCSGSVLIYMIGLLSKSFKNKSAYTAQDPWSTVQLPLLSRLY